MGRVTQFVKVPTGDDKIDRMQDRLVEAMRVLRESPQAIVTQKGSIVAGMADGAPVEQKVGTDGQALVADSTSATGLRFATITSGSGLTPTTQTASYSAANGDLVLVNAPAANTLITLPAPTAGFMVGVKDISGFAGGGFDGSGKKLAINSTSGKVDGVTQVEAYDDFSGGTFIADGTNWWILDGEEHFGVDPRSISGLQCDYDPGRGYTIGAITAGVRNLFITSLLDQSGNGNTITNGTNPPDWDRGGPNGRARMTMNGGQFLQSGTGFTPLSTTVTVLAICGCSQLGNNASFQCVVAQNANNSTATGFACFVNAGATATPMEAYVSSKTGTLGANGAGATGLNVSTQETTLNQHLWTFTIDPTTPFVHMDGYNTTNAPDLFGFTATSGRLYVGQSHFNAADADQLKGSIGRVIMFSPGVSAANLARLEHDLMKQSRLRL